MSWIAKNSVSGTVYGVPFDSVYDCQSFIDKELLILEYEFQRVYSLEKDIISHLDNKSKSRGLCFDIFSMLQQSLLDLSTCKHTKILKESIKACFLSNEDSLHDKIISISKQHWCSNNVIRCYNLQQNRFADGFDF